MLLWGETLKSGGRPLMPVDSYSCWALFPILAAVARTDALKRQRGDVTYHPVDLERNRHLMFRQRPGICLRVPKQHISWIR